ncbi:MAG: SLOG family protein [Acidimicrobiales bacterium]
MSNSEPSTVAFTDGACSGNPGPGGWAWIVPDGRFGAGPAEHTTNQRMELQAVLEAVNALAGNLEIISDSTYVVNCFRDRWWEGWLKRGWKNSQKKPVANQDLWEPLIELYRSRENELAFTWVKGHSGNLWNDYADRLAVEARFTQQTRSGDFTPAEIQEPPVPGAAATVGSAGSASVTSMRKLAVAGHQPPEIGGYGENPTANRIRARMVDILRAKAELSPGLQVLSGLRLGAEQLGAEAALDAGLGYTAVLPYPNPDKRWPEESRRHFQELLGRAEKVIELDKSEPESTVKAGAALRRRDVWLAAEADEAIVVWDRSDPRVAKTFKLYEAALGDDVWTLDPNEV